MGLSFPEMVLAASALYQSKTARPIVSKTVAGWQKGAAGEFGVAGPHRVAAPQPLGAQDRWMPGDPFLMGSAVPQFLALKLDTRSESLLDLALRRHLDAVRMVYQDADRSARLNLGTCFQVANRLGAARVKDLFSVGIGHPVLLDSRWNKPIVQRLGTVNSAGRALPRNLGWAVAFQEGKRRRLPGIRSAVASVAEADAQLMAQLQAAPELFVSPRSMVLHGMKVGFKKGTGKIEIADEAAVVRLVRKHFPEQFDVLVKTTEKPVKKALGALTVAELKKLGVQVEDTGDVVFVADATSSVDKLVAALLKGVEDEQEAEVAA